VLVWHGSLWHGGGANATDERRVGIAMNYCAGWIRQQENQQLGIPREIAARFSPRLRELALPERPSGPAAPTSLTGTGDRATETASAASAACGAPIALEVSGGKKYSSEHHV